MLYKPWSYEGLNFKNRLVMPGMTRARADPATGIPTSFMKTYYEQRAESAGLMITEMIPVSQKTNSTPGSGTLFTDAHVEKWKEIVQAVHAKKTVFFAQLGHVGRIMHPDLNNGELPISASPIAAPGESNTPNGKKPNVVPTEATHEQIKEIIGDYIRTAQGAKRAGFDGVEIGAATGLLLDQFLKTSSNQRKDQYGGPIENRARLLFEVIDSVTGVYPPNRIGVKLSPVTRAWGMFTEDPKTDLAYLLKEIERRGLLFANLVEPENQFGDKDGIHQIPFVAEEAGKHYKGMLIMNGYKSVEERIDALEKGIPNMIAFGKLFGANPDLLYKLEHKLPLNQFNFGTAFGKGDAGYNDYPVYQEQHK